MDKRSEQLEELKNMLIGKWILNNISYDEWLRYKLKSEEINDEEWIWREGMVILLTEEVMYLMVEKCEDEVWEIFYNFARPSSVSYREMQFSLARLCTSVSDRMGQGKKWWSGHRVLCWVVGWMVLEYEIIWKDETIDCVVNYLVKLLECDVMEMVKWAILTGEKWSVEMKMQLNSEQRDQLRTALTRHSSQTLEGALDIDLGDTERYQVMWCARWCEDNVVSTGLGEIPPIKLSRDRFEARYDEDYYRIMPSYHFLGRSKIFSPVRSQFSVKSNVYFYEVICVTNEDIYIGWCTKETKFGIDFLRSAYKYKNSFLLKVGKKCNIQHNDQRHSISISPPHNSVNVVGCLLDVDNQRFEFYLNGRTIECPTPMHFNPPYFATVGFSRHQHCNFNFGQSPFKYPPGSKRFTTFNEQCGGDVRRYQLAETEFWSREFWFKQSLVDNQISLYFDDEIQEIFNIEVKKVEKDVEINRDIGEWRLENVEMEEGWKGVRFIQAIIEVMGKFGGMDKVDVMAQFVGQVVANNIDQVLYQYKLLELLYPYLQLIPTNSSLTQHRSICIVLLHLSKCCRNDGYNFIQEIHSSTFTYLIRTLTSTSDQWTQLFVLIALGDLEISKAEKKEIKSCGKIIQMVDTWRNQFEGKNVWQLLYSESENRLLYQIFLCSNNLVSSQTYSIQNPHATLNSLDLTSHLTLSPCRLSARSDWHWQSVRSVCQVSKCIFYFEVVLLTAGPMAIGWATRRTEIEKIGYFTKKHQLMIGFDEFSISFDGYNRCIYHDDKTFQLENIPRWNAGDIVGCLIDKNRKSFNFYLNGSQINFTPQSPIYFSDQPYHALISLSQFQQVYLNFGQFPFSLHRPKYIDFMDFYSSKQKVQEIQTKTVVNFNNANLEKNLISIDSNVKNGDVKITGSASTSKRSGESPVSIGNISSVQTLANVNIEKGNNFQIERLRMQCRLCYSSPSTKLVRFVCCDTLPLCLDCLRTMAECPKCKKLTNESQTETENQTSTKPIYQCTLCTRQRASFRFISCNHFNLCQTCVNQILFKDCPRCQMTV